MALRIINHLAAKTMESDNFRFVRIKSIRRSCWLLSFIASTVDWFTYSYDSFVGVCTCLMWHCFLLFCTADFASSFYVFILCVTVWTLNTEHTISLERLASKPFTNRWRIILILQIYYISYFTKHWLASVRVRWWTIELTRIYSSTVLNAIRLGEIKRVFCYGFCKKEKDLIIFSIEKRCFPLVWFIVL